MFDDGDEIGSTDTNAMMENRQERRKKSSKTIAANDANFDQAPVALAA